MQREKVKFERGGGEFDSQVNIDGSTSLSTQQIFKGMLCANPDAEIVYKLPSATTLVKEAPKEPIAGWCKRFSIRNDGRATITLEIGDGGSMNGSPNIPVSSYAAQFVLRFTSVSTGAESYQLIRE